MLPLSLGAMLKSVGDDHLRRKYESPHSADK